ncbi:MAG: dihydrofolate reductase [Hyphomicrobiaceae bacterium]
MKISLIVAVAENGVIGRNGTLPWHVPADLKTFRRHTMGKPVIMGRKTYASIGKPLPGRDNIVVTRDAGFSAAGTNRAAGIDEAFDIARQKAAERGVDEIMVIGGAEIFALTVPVADRIYLTRIHAHPDGDVTLPEPDPHLWREVSRSPVAPDPRDDATATLLIFERAAS